MRRPSSILTIVLPVALAACSHTQTDAVPASVGLSEAHAGDDSYLQGKTALANGEFAGAVEHFRRALRSDPESVSAINGLAVAYDEIGRFDVAQGLYRRALVLEPHSVATLNNLGRSLLRQGSAGTALTYLTAAQESATPAQLPVIDANLAAARAVLAPHAALDRTAPPTAALERTGAREHFLRTEGTPRHLIAVEPGATRTSEVAPAGPVMSAQQPLVEISNGVGRRRMAARVAGFLKAQGVPVRRLTNADHFGHAKTQVLYRPGHEVDAIRIAQLLPSPVEPVLDQAQGSAVRVVLGRDLTDLDRQLLSQGKGADA